MEWRVDRQQLPLNALRAFEAAARHLNLSRAAIELCVTQAALSHQIRGLEDRLGVKLFRRVPRGLVLTDEGHALVPVLSRSFDGIGEMLDRFADGRFRETVAVGVVGSFAVGWLLPRLPDFERRHPAVDLRIFVNNNRVDIAGEGLDFAVRFGPRPGPGVEAIPLFPAAMTPHCAPALVAGLERPADLARHRLLRSYRAGEWEAWFAKAGADCPLLRGPVLDTSIALAEVAASGLGIALLPIRLFEPWVSAGRLVKPFHVEVEMGHYALTYLGSRPMSAGMRAFRDWLLETAAS